MYNHHMRLKWFLISALSLLALCACQPLPEPSPGLLPTASVTRMPVSPTPSQQTTATATAAPVLAATVPPTTVEPAPPATSPAVAQVIGVRLCSPLAETELQALPDIVSAVYDPPPMGKDDRHQGVDFAYYRRGDRESIAGEVVQAILLGVVAFAQEDRLPYGNLVIIETDQDALPDDLAANLGVAPGEALYQLYAHLGAPPILVQGQAVDCGQALGIVGQTGYNIPVAHLHLELRIGPVAARFEGMAFYDTRATELEMDAYRRWRMSGEFRHLDPMAVLQDFPGSE